MIKGTVIYLFIIEETRHMMSYRIILIKSVVGFLWDKNQYNFKTIVVSARLKTSYVPSEKINPL